ncbi:hypothetical protein EVAR_95699_1 [Eumeta japonica]|uniref:Uncharacterized protein n=1 Tax=Eumeta variegata TaxID=151549 RepID=A0A4C1VK14_EUMVA|nr:hypothetical protein EVAR_95699_1 [Eumeta japonica]
MVVRRLSSEAKATLTASSVFSVSARGARGARHSRRASELTSHQRIDGRRRPWAFATKSLLRMNRIFNGGAKVSWKDRREVPPELSLTGRNSESCYFTSVFCESESI